MSKNNKSQKEFVVIVNLCSIFLMLLAVFVDNDYLAFSAISCISLSCFLCGQDNGLSKILRLANYSASICAACLASMYFIIYIAYYKKTPQEIEFHPLIHFVTITSFMVSLELFIYDFIKRRMQD